LSVLNKQGFLLMQLHKNKKKNKKGKQRINRNITNKINDIEKKRGLGFIYTLSKTFLASHVPQYTPVRFSSLWVLGMLASGLIRYGALVGSALIS